MKVERITVTAGRTRKDPVHDFSSLKSEITVEAALTPGENWETATIDLQQQAERLIEDHISTLSQQLALGAAAEQRPNGTAQAIAAMKEPAAPAFPADPVARTMAALVTSKQLVAIRAIANDRGLNAEALCVALLKCRPEELSRRAASAFIDRLKIEEPPVVQPPLGWDDPQPARQPPPDDDCPF